MAEGKPAGAADGARDGCACNGIAMIRAKTKAQARDGQMFLRALTIR
jgi:hypothetical protein